MHRKSSNDRLEKKKAESLRIRQYVDELESIHKQNDELKEVQEQYKQLLNKHQDLLAAVRLQQEILHTLTTPLIAYNNAARLQFLNKSFESLTGYTQNLLLNMSPVDLFADSEEGEHICRSILDRGEVYRNYKTYLLTQSRETAPVTFSNHFMEKSAVALFEFHPVNETFAGNEGLERMDRMALLGELATGIAHEIRNPLAGIKSSAEVIKESFSPGDFRSPMVSRIIREVDRSNHLLKRFFDYAQPVKPKSEARRVQQIVDAVAMLLKTRLRKQKVRLELHLHDDLPEVLVDSGQIEQALMNIMLNAAEAVERDGAIKITTEWQQSDSHTPSFYLVISDNGCGIAAQNLERIFNPFFTTKSQGIGLGLSIAMRLIKENGGDLEVQSTEGEGSVFKIKLPLAKTAGD